MEKQSLIKSQSVAGLPAIVPEAISRPEYTAEQQTGSLLDYWQAIRKSKLTLLAFGVVGLAVGIGASLSQSKMYRASTSIEIQDAKDDNLATKILSPQPDARSTDTQSDIQTPIKILQSRSLIDRALDKTHITSLADLDAGSSESLPGLKLFHSSAAEPNRDALFEKVVKNLKVSAVSETRIVEISYEATNPGIAAGFANALTAEFIAQNEEAHGQMNRKTTQWLVSQLDELRGKLQQSQDALQAYARKEGLIYTGAEQSISADALRGLQSEVSRAQADRVEKQSRFEVARTATPESVPEILNDSNLKAMETNLTDLRKQEAEMGVTFKPDYVKAKRLRAEISSLESDLQTKRAAIISRLDNELQESRRREQLIESAYARQSRVVVDDSQKSIQYDMLKHDVDTNRQIYQLMLQRVKESGIASALKAANVRVIDPATPPQHPYKPKLPMNAAAGLMAGLMLGIAGVIIRSKADESLQEPGDAGLLLGIPELGVIPAGNAELSGLSRLKAAYLPGKGVKDPNQQIALSPMVADSFRAVLASILFAGARQRQRVLVVTSASPGEGKTTTSSNLAVTLAKMGRKVLLIDGDIRSPRLHSIFGLRNSTGLTTALTQIAINESLTDTFIQETGVSNLHVLTSGPAIQAGADLMFSRLMPGLIAGYREQYDMVLIDTPPMLVMPDARALGRVADAVVLIARAGKTTRSAIQAAYRRFVEDRTPVLGVVLNSWNAKMSPHKYYSSYNEPADQHALIKATPAGA